MGKTLSFIKKELLPKIGVLENQIESLQLQLHLANAKIEELENKKKNNNVIIKGLSSNEGNVEHTVMSFMAKKMKLPIKSVKEKVAKISHLPCKEPTVKITFKKPFERKILKKEATDEKISCHADLNLETRIKRSILWKIGTKLKERMKNDFSISRKTQLCMVGRDKKLTLLTYHETIDKFKDQLTETDIQQAYEKLNDIERKSCASILLL